MLRMYTLCLAGLIGLVLGAAGCMGGGHRGENLPPTNGSFYIVWDVAWAGDGATDCASAGIAEVDLDALNSYTGHVDHFTFACSDYQGTSTPLPVDDYTVALRGYSAGNTLLSEWPAPPDVFVSHIYAGSVTKLPDVVLTVQ